MTSSSTAAVDTALAYYHAWTGGDFETAMTYVREDIVCHGPGGRLEGTEAFRAFMGPFAAMLTRAELLGAFGDESTALLMYDTDTAAVHNAPGAELHRVVDGVITELWIVFDRLPFQAARRPSD